MGCTPVKMEGGGFAFACSRGARPAAGGRACFAQGCMGRAFHQCDHPAGGGKTCDRWCCPRHFRNVARDRDLCLEHFFAEGGGS
jgi:hypothetical protein